MAAMQKKQSVPKKKRREKDADRSCRPAAVSDGQCKALDEFIEDVLQEAGEEFLDEFRQIEGE